MVQYAFVYIMAIMLHFAANLRAQTQTITKRASAMKK